MKSHISTLETARPDKVMTFKQWAALNAMSISAAKRLLKAGKGPKILQISERKIGVRESDAAAWQESRVRSIA